MQFVPMIKIMERVSQNGDSDYELFNELLLVGEFIIKTTVAAFVASIEDDRDSHRYQLLHTLVRANSLGDWVESIDRICSGPASQHLSDTLGNARLELTRRVGNDSWQHKAVYDLQQVLAGIEANVQQIGNKVHLRTWFTKFVELRNKTRGHGAMTPARCANVVRELKNSIEIVLENNPIYQLPWAYLHRNLSGKYKVTELGGDTSKFSELKTVSAALGENYLDGVYLWADEPKRVDLLHSDVDASDFFVPNGAFNEKNYELHSLITDSRRKGDARPYISAAGDRPPSETEGKGELDVIGNVFTNLPSAPIGYVKRPSLETELKDELTNDRHAIVTLVGRGGIGKTSLVLAVLHEIASTQRYALIIWFSARDIDLTLTGPKVVRPSVLTDKDIAEEYRRLIGNSSNNQGENISAVSTMSKHMHEQPHGAATLFVFDNFETVSSPVDVFQWIDTNIRLPNKAVITSRFRDFRGDYPIEVSGMENEEADKLISRTAKDLGIEDKIGKDRRQKIIEGSGGHPYVIKIFLGEVANAGNFGNPNRMMARNDDILDALFDRTYANLSPLASRIFLTLSRWRTRVPQLAVEAVLRWRSTEDVNPEGALDELVRMSLVERTPAQDNQDFLEVPVTAALFGKKKFEVSPQRQLIEDDVSFLQDIGSTTAKDKESIGPRIKSFFTKAARRIGKESGSVDEIRRVLEYLARGYTPAWLFFADLEYEVGGGANDEAECVRRFLEQTPEGEEARTAWVRLIDIYRTTKDINGVCSAFLRYANISEPELYEISDIVNWLNGAGGGQVNEQMDISDRQGLFEPLTKLMERHLANASATDLSRLAWLYLRMGDDRRARELANQGLQMEPDNRHCRGLVERLERVRDF